MALCRAPVLLPCHFSPEEGGGNGPIFPLRPPGAGRLVRWLRDWQRSGLAPQTARQPGGTGGDGSNSSSGQSCFLLTFTRIWMLVWIQSQRQFYCCPDLLLSVLLHMDALTAEGASFRWHSRMQDKKEIYVGFKLIINVLRRCDLFYSFILYDSVGLSDFSETTGSILLLLWSFYH